MPNVENNNNKNNTPSLPKSSKKEKRKSLAVTTEKDASPVRRETLSPITPALESGESGLENVNKNPYIDVINKKLKKLKKFMTKIEKYEKIKNNNDPEGAQLNEDQIKALERKGESSGAIKEFEETLKQMESVEKDEIKKQAELKKVQQAERDQAIADAVEEVKASQSKSLLQLILFFRLVHFQQRGIIQLSDIEFEAVETFRAKLTTLSEEAKSDELYEEKIQQVLDYVNKLHSGDESSITKSLPNGVHETNEISATDEPSSAYAVSYSQLRSLIQSPPILESSGEQDELQETFEIIPTSEVTIQPEHIDDSANVTNEYTIPSSGLQFMLQSDDQSQPQVFDANNTTYGYQSTDAEQIPTVVTGEIMVDHNIQEQYQQQNYEQSYEQSYDTYAMEQQQQQQQQQQFPVEQQQQYIGEQQQIFVEQSEQQVISAETEESSQQQEEPLIAQEPQSTSEDQADSKQPQTAQQNSNQPPPLSQGSGRHRGRAGYRGNRGYKGQPRRDSGGYGNYHEGGYGGGYQDGGFRGGYQDGGFRGGYRGMRGGRGGRGGGYQGNRGAQHRQRSQ